MTCHKSNLFITLDFVNSKDKYTGISGIELRCYLCMRRWRWWRSHRLIRRIHAAIIGHGIHQQGWVGSPRNRRYYATSWLMVLELVFPMEAFVADFAAELVCARQMTLTMTYHGLRIWKCLLTQGTDEIRVEQGSSHYSRWHPSQKHLLQQHQRRVSL